MYMYTLTGTNKQTNKQKTKQKKPKNKKNPKTKTTSKQQSRINEHSAVTAWSILFIQQKHCSLWFVYARGQMQIFLGNTEQVCHKKCQMACVFKEYMNILKF